MLRSLSQSRIPSAPSVHCTRASLSRETILATLNSLSPTDREEFKSHIPDQGEISLQELADALAVSSIQLCFHLFSETSLDRHSSRSSDSISPPPSITHQPIEEHLMEFVSSSTHTTLPASNPNGETNASATSQTPNLPPYEDLVKLIHSPTWILRALFAIPDFVKQTHFLEYLIQNRIHYHLNHIYGDLSTHLAEGDLMLEADDTKNTLLYYATCCSSALKEEAKQCEKTFEINQRDSDAEMVDATRASAQPSTSSFKNGYRPETPLLSRTIAFTKPRFPPPRRTNNDPYFNFRTK
ncbi:hypothetical protein Agabi119p4_8982 [Agaricus bisporus var. burnettii]|uniref:Uncharacterized protein n=1 Tax=Agaricus bisporus var. burnettii TaxID=192524 RepID=A0A8H7C490_AGABI|nr:hypothetical protein Agabi119p4_8982 [Agaricus bisporus var. burnettii]